MNENQPNLSIHIITADEKLTVKTYRYAYRNLMALLINHLYLEHFGECGGQGRCATCLVKITGNDLLMNPVERNEETTIQKNGITGTGIRLACQILIDESLDGCLVEIIE